MVIIMQLYTDYRYLNKKMIKDYQYPLPLRVNLRVNFRKVQLFSIDLRDHLSHASIIEDNCKDTFIVPNEYCKSLEAPFSFCNLSAKIIYSKNL